MEVAAGSNKLIAKICCQRELSEQLAIGMCCLVSNLLRSRKVIWIALVPEMMLPLLLSSEIQKLQIIFSIIFFSNKNIVKWNEPFAEAWNKISSSMNVLLLWRQKRESGDLRSFSESESCFSVIRIYLVNQWMEVHFSCTCFLNFLSLFFFWNFFHRTS